jgi:hypothetical protein
MDFDKTRRMKIICDTNVWYKIAEGVFSKEKLQELHLVATFNNIKEVAKTPNLIDKYEFVAEVVRSIFRYKKEVIFFSPFVHIAKLKDPRYEFDIHANMGDILKFTELIAKGHEIKQDKKEEFKAFIEGMKKDLEAVTAPWNKEVDRIKGNITDKKTHKKEDPTELNRALISYMVEVATNGKVSLKDGFDWSQLELLEKTLSAYFLELEISGMKIDENDWFDLFLLAYVQPGSLVWTYEKRWLIMIKEKAKLGKYLFDPASLN